MLLCISGLPSIRETGVICKLFSANVKKTILCKTLQNKHKCWIASYLGYKDLEENYVGFTETSLVYKRTGRPTNRCSKCLEWIFRWRRPISTCPVLARRAGKRFCPRPCPWGRWWRPPHCPHSCGSNRFCSNVRASRRKGRWCRPPPRGSLKIVFIRTKFLHERSVPVSLPRVCHRGETLITNNIVKGLPGFAPALKTIGWSLYSK